MVEYGSSIFGSMHQIDGVYFYLSSFPKEGMWFNIRFSKKYPDINRFQEIINHVKR
jgi:hypothetical protein